MELKFEKAFRLSDDVQRVFAPILKNFWLFEFCMKTGEFLYDTSFRELRDIFFKLCELDFLSDEEVAEARKIISNVYVDIQNFFAEIKFASSGEIVIGKHKAKVGSRIKEKIGTNINNRKFADLVIAILITLLMKSGITINIIYKPEENHSSYYIRHEDFNINLLKDLYITMDKGYLYSGTDTDSPVVTSLNPYQPVGVIKENNDGWCLAMVKINGVAMQGWIQKEKLIPLFDAE